MRRFWIFILLGMFLAVGVVDARMIVSLVGGVSNYCSSCTPGDPTDVCCEDSEGSNTIETGATDWTKAQCSDWTATVDTGAYIYEATHSGTLSCTDKGSYALEIYSIDAVGGNEESYILRPITATDDLYVAAYMNILNTDDWDINDEFSYFFAIGETEDDYVIGCRVQKNDSGNLIVRLRYWNDGCAAGTSVDGSTTLSLNTWYRVGMKWDASGDVAECYLDTNLDGTWDETVSNSGNVCDDSVDYLGIGMLDILTFISNEATRFQIDIIGVDDDTMPGVCGN